MPTLDEMVASVYSDLADDGKDVFTTLQVEDFIRGGIADLNRVSPEDTIYDLPLTTDPDTGEVSVFSYDVPIELPYRVEWIDLSTGWAEPIDEAVMGQSVGTGWVFRKTATGGTIDLPQWFVSPLNGFDPAVFTIRLHGYQKRPLPYDVDPNPSPTLPLSPEEEYSVRRYAKSAGFDLLSHDRSLFAQWQGQTNNTDVSPTQMMQMAVNAKADWERQRGLIRTIRRYW